MTPANDDAERVKLVRLLGQVTADSFTPADVIELLVIPEGVLKEARDGRD